MWGRDRVPNKRVNYGKIDNKKVHSAVRRMSSAVPASAVARHLIENSGNHSGELTPLKLMKLVYLSHAWHLALRDQDLIQEEVQAWQYGPVIPELYRLIRAYRAEPVPASALPHGSQLSSDQKAVVDAVWDTYRPFSGVQLSALTHKLGTPWDKAYKKGRNVTIPTFEIKNHFKELLSD